MKERLWLTGTLWGAVIIATLMIISSILFAAVVVYILIIGGASIVVILLAAGVHTWQVKRLPIKQDKREAAKHAHELQIEQARLALDKERQAHELQLERERHEQDLRIAHERFQLETHLLLTRITPDAKGHYPYIAHPDGGYYPLPNVNMRQVSTPQVTDQAHMLATGGASTALPTLVRYDDIRGQIPRGHALVGISANGIETKEDKARALLWVVGASGTGKTNTVTLRVDDDYNRGHVFLGVDPHAFKSDSLTNAIRGYTDRFLMPIAQSLEDIDDVLQAFLDEFNRRKSGAVRTYKPITLVVDEVGSMCLDIDPKDDLEVEVARKLKEIARICGQESRGFEMYGIYISQDAAGLAWLRKRALMVLAHQVMMMSERLLVCNQNREVANQMDTWPIGRTLAYGIAFTEGQIVVQQPQVTPRIVDADPEPVPANVSFFKSTDAQKKVKTGTQVPALESLTKRSEPGTGRVPGTDEKQFTIEQETEFIRRFKACGSIKESLAQMHLGSRYQPCASRLVYDRKLRKGEKVK